MARDEDDDDNDEHITSAPRPRRRRERDDDDPMLAPIPHSGLGVASFVMALTGGITGLFSLGTAAWIGVKNGPLPQNDPAAVMLGLAIIGSGLLSLFGLVLGIVGMMQSNRRIVFAVLGMIFNLLIVFAICGVVGLGIAIGNH